MIREPMRAGGCRPGAARSGGGVGAPPGPPRRRVPSPGADRPVPGRAPRARGPTPARRPAVGPVLDLDVVLAGQVPAGLSQAVTAVSTPGSPDYRHYLTPADYAAPLRADAGRGGPGVLRAARRGADRGYLAPGSTLLPVSGTASVVSAALGTPLESVKPPGKSARAIVNTASPQVPPRWPARSPAWSASTGRFRSTPCWCRAHARAPRSDAESPSSPRPARIRPGRPTPARHPRPCAAAQAEAAGRRVYTSTQLASVFGLDQIFEPGPDRDGQSIAMVEFEQYSRERRGAFQAVTG